MKNVREYHHVEVLPPDNRPVGKNDPLAAWIARLMDNQFVIPGTNIRFGLDPILGLIPAGGDSASALISAMLLLQSARAGVPRIVLGRMAGNIFVNAALGAIPVAGDAFSFWFKSNARNYALHQKHAGTGRAPTQKDWLFVAALLGAIFLIVVFALALTIGLAAKAVGWLTGS